MNRRQIGKKAMVLVPDKYFWPLNSLSKNALADIVWSLAAAASESADDHDAVIATIHREWAVVAQHREDSVTPFCKALRSAKELL